MRDLVTLYHVMNARQTQDIVVKYFATLVSKLYLEDEDYTIGGEIELYTLR